MSKAQRRAMVAEAVTVAKATGKFTMCEPVKRTNWKGTAARVGGIKVHANRYV